MPTRTLAFAVPGDINTPTGGYIYDRKLAESLRASGWTVDVMSLGSSFPHPSDEDMSSAARALAALPAHQPVIIDGLALGAFDPDVLSGVSAPVIALIHHPLALEEDLGEERQEYLYQRERDNLQKVRHVIVPSQETASRLITDYGVPSTTLTVVQPGLSRDISLGRPIDPPLILSVGIQVRRKGHDVLLEALALLTDVPWQAVVVGQERDPDYSGELSQLCDERGLSDRVSFAGFVSDSELARLYSHASVFALATRFEGYGMVFDEAKVAGLPIVSCDVGAVRQTLSTTASILVSRDDPVAFSRALRTVLTDGSRRMTMAEASSRAGQAVPTWERASSKVEVILETIMADQRDGSSEHGRG